MKIIVERYNFIGRDDNSLDEIEFGKKKKIASMIEKSIKT